MGFPGGTVIKRHKTHTFNPWVGKIPWVENVNSLQYSCLENSMDRGASRATVHGVTVRYD